MRSLVVPAKSTHQQLFNAAGSIYTWKGKPQNYKVYFPPLGEKKSNKLASTSKLEKILNNSQNSFIKIKSFQIILIFLIEKSFIGSTGKNHFHLANS